MVTESPPGNEPALVMKSPPPAAQRRQGCGAERRGSGSVSEEQHPLGARLPHQACVLQHGGLPARVSPLLLIHAVRHYGLLVKHLQAVRFLTATFIHCSNKKYGLKTAPIKPLSIS